MADANQQGNADKPRVLAAEETPYLISAGDDGAVPAPNASAISAADLALLRADDDADIGKDGPRKFTFNELLEKLGVGWYQIFVLQVSGTGWLVRIKTFVCVRSNQAFVFDFFHTSKL